MSIIVQVGALRPLTGSSTSDSSLSIIPHSDEVEMSGGPSTGGGDIYRRTVHTYPGCFGLPYQDHNYGALPPITPPLSPTLTLPPPVKINGQIEIVEDVGRPTLIGKEEVIDDSITRCICEFQHDDGYMICCDRCSVWQHIDCMGIDRNNIPDSYYCEQCQARPVDVTRAKLIQSRKKEELANLDTSATDTDPEELANRLAALEKKSPYKKVTKQRRNSKLKDKMGTKQKTAKEKKGLKKEKENVKIGNLKIKFKNGKDGSQKVVKTKNRRNSQSTVNKVNGGEQWSYDGFDRFEEAKENQYSKDVQEIFSRYNVNGLNLDDVHCDSERLLDQLWCLGQTLKKQVIIEAKEPILPGLAVLEYKGIVLLRQHYVDTNLFFKIAHPHVLFYSKFEDIDLCIDSSSYGNKARYIRRSCSPNAEVRHLLEHGRIHFVIFSTKEIDKGEEITIPFDYNYQECMYCVECACLRNNCTVSKFWKKMAKNTQNNKVVKKARLKRPSGSNDITIKTEQLSPLKHEILKIKESIPQSPVKIIKKIIPLPSTPIKVEPKSPIPEVKSPVPAPLPPPPVIKHSPPKSATKQTPKPHPKPAPVRVKHESGDKTTQNTTVSPTVSTPEKHETEEADHKMTREERKMNAIMKAFEKLEKREERRKEALARIDGGRKSQDEVKKVSGEIRLSSEEESKTGTSEEVSDCKDETFKPETPQKTQRKGRKRPLRRRSRVNSMSAVEPPTPPVETLTVHQIAQSTPTTPLPLDTNSNANTEPTGFKFLKTKKHLFNEWLTEKGNDSKTTSTSSTPVPPPLEIKVDETIFVPCLPSPRNAMEHLQRRNSQSAGCGKTIGESSTRGSAKKRWLRQAMHEVPTSSENGSVSPNIGCTSPNPGLYSPTPGSNPVIGSPTHGASPSSSPPVDFVTPLKKRRLARESLSQDVPISSTPSTPVPTVDMSSPLTSVKLEGTTDIQVTSTGNTNTAEGQTPSLPDDNSSSTVSNASKCYKSDSTDMESETEHSVSRITAPDIDILNDSAENSQLSDNISSDNSNSALNITADSGVVVNSQLDTPEKMEVDVEKVTANSETENKSVADGVATNKQSDLKINGDNLFDNLKNIVKNTNSETVEIDNTVKQPEKTDSTESNNLVQGLKNTEETNESESLKIPLERIEENMEYTETSQSAVKDMESDSNVVKEDKDFTSDSEATKILKENGFVCKSLSHNCDKTESFGFVPTVSMEKPDVSLDDNKQISTVVEQETSANKSTSLPLNSVDNVKTILEPSNQVVLENIRSSSLNNSLSSSDNMTSELQKDSSTVSSDHTSAVMPQSQSSVSLRSSDVVTSLPSQVMPASSASNVMPATSSNTTLLASNVMPASSGNTTLLASNVMPSLTSNMAGNVVSSSLASSIAPSTFSTSLVTSILKTPSVPLNQPCSMTSTNVTPSISPPIIEHSQPCKKKVSLLEYRKRLKSKPKETSGGGNTVANNSSLPSRRVASGGNYTSHSIRARTLPSLPSLPLFVDKNQKKKDIKEKKSWHNLSLTERLRQEFGVEASEEGEKSDDSREGSLTPPPPPPPLPSHNNVSPRLLKYLEGDDKAVTQTGVPPPPSVPHPGRGPSPNLSHQGRGPSPSITPGRGVSPNLTHPGRGVSPNLAHPGRGPSTPPPPPPPPKSTNRIPSLMSLPLTNRPITPLGVGGTTNQLLTLPSQTLNSSAVPAPQTAPVLVNYPAQNGTTVNCQTASPQTLPFHPTGSVNPSSVPSTFPVVGPQGTSPQSYTTTNNNTNRYRYRRNSSPSTMSHNKGREVPFSHSYNHTSDTISRSEWSNGRRNTYSKYH